MSSFSLQQNLHKLLDSVDDIVTQAKIYREVEKLIDEHNLEKLSAEDSALLKALKDPEVTLKAYDNYLSSEGASKNTIKDYYREAQNLVHYIVRNDIKLISLTLDEVRGYLAAQRAKRKICTNAYRRLIFSLKSYLKFLIKANYIYLDLSEIKAPTKTDPIVEYFRDDDIKKLTTWLEKFGKPVHIVTVSLLLNCGLRRQELINLNWEDTNFKDGEIKILHSKGDKSRFVNFGPNTKSILLNYRKKSGYYKGPIIRGMLSKKKIERSSLQNMIRKILKASKVYRDGLTIHSFRHTYATKLVGVVGLEKTSKSLGHSEFETTRGYLHFDRSDYKDAIIDIELQKPASEEKD